MLVKYGRTISLSCIFLGIGLIGLWLLLSSPSPMLISNTILVRSTGGLAPVLSADRIPGNILQQAGIRLFPGDRLLVDGQPYKPDHALPQSSNRYMQFIPASKITILQGDVTRTIFSSAPTVGQALWDAEYRLTTTDTLNPPAETLLAGDMTINLVQAREVSVEDNGKIVQIFSSAATVEAALAENGLALSVLDTSEPEANQPLPMGKPIKITRVREEIILENKTIPFEKETVSVDDLEAGKSETIQQGIDGLEASRVRVRYSDGEETARQVEGSVVLREMVKQITHVSNQAAVVSTDIGSLDYYKTAQVYATSYSPCRQGYDYCSTGTASGTPLQKGVVAVTQSWYRIFGGTQVYIPGYGIGTVADTGGGIPGKYWIDLGYGEEDFVNWHETVTVYFLNPAPANVPEVLP